jgi:hypothetical protein
MIEELLKAKKIAPEEYDLYMLYQANELGRKCMDRMMHETYMDEPTDKEFNGVGFAFYDGRRSVFRDIRRAISKIEYFLKEANNVKPEPEPKPRGRRK